MVLPCSGLAAHGKADIGPLIEVGLAASTEWKSPDEIPRFKALIDSGAEETCISRTAAALLGIRDDPIGTRKVTSPGGSANLPVYEVHLIFFARPGMTMALEADVVETRSDSPDFDVLLGRDVLSRAIFTMDFGGQFAFALI